MAKAKAITQPASASNIPIPTQIREAIENDKRGEIAQDRLMPSGLTSLQKTFMQTKPSIVFCHGIWADRLGFSKLIPPLRAEGREVIAAEYGPRHQRRRRR